MVRLFEIITIYTNPEFPRENLLFRTLMIDTREKFYCMDRLFQILTIYKSRIPEEKKINFMHRDDRHQREILL